MALLISKSKFRNTQVAAPKLYARLQYTCPAEGTKANVNLLIGVDKQAALTNKLIATNIPEYLQVLIPEGQNQDLAVIHTLVKASLEALDLGLEITIDLV